MTRHWTRPDVDAAILNTAPDTHVQVSILQRVVDDLLAERDAMLPEPVTEWFHCAFPGCTWHIAYPPDESIAADDDIREHVEEHEREIEALRTDRESVRVYLDRISVTDWPLEAALNEAYNHFQKVLAERDALAAKTATPTPASTWRLQIPGSDTSYDVEILDEMVGWGFPAVTVQFAGEAREPMAVAKSWLVEVKPASIDDPVHLPIEVEDDQTDACIFLSANEPGSLELRLRVREAFLKDKRGSYVTAVTGLYDVEGRRNLARALWQSTVEGS